MNHKLISFLQPNKSFLSAQQKPPQLNPFLVAPIHIPKKRNAHVCEYSITVTYFPELKAKFLRKIVVKQLSPESFEHYASAFSPFKVA